MRVGRNEPCPCGSGKKFKNCCDGRTAVKSSKGLIIIVAAIAAVAALGFLPLILPKSEAKQASAPVAPPRTPKEQPPGPAPAGKVWSKEHGHWHDAQPNAANSGIQVEMAGGPSAAPVAATASTQPRPQPAGAAPPGKVWSAEHGHYHSVAGASRPAPLPAGDPNAIRVLGQTVPSTPPPGPAPAGKVWSPEHRHWHEAKQP